MADFGVKVMLLTAILALLSLKLSILGELSGNDSTMSQLPR